jgi:nitrogenase molybdenum-iron protein beta chain
VSDVFDTPTDGKFRLYDGGTTIDQVKAATYPGSRITAGSDSVVR